MSQDARIIALESALVSRLGLTDFQAMKAALGAGTPIPSATLDAARPVITRHSADLVAVASDIVAQPSAGPSTVAPPRPEEHCFHNIRRWLHSDRSEPEPAGVCPVCYAELSIGGITPLPTSDTNSSSPTNPSPAVALHCTHMLCAPCHATIWKLSTGCDDEDEGIYLQDEDDFPDSPLCPVCRRNFSARDCEHSVHYPIRPVGQAAGGEGDEKYAAADCAILIAEGGRVPGFCVKCCDEGDDSEEEEEGEDDNEEEEEEDGNEEDENAEEVGVAMLVCDRLLADDLNWLRDGHRQQGDLPENFLNLPGDFRTSSAAARFSYMFHQYRLAHEGGSLAEFEQALSDLRDSYID